MEARPFGGGVVSTTPAQRSANASIAAHSMWARCPDRARRLRNAHAALEARIARDFGIPADLPPAEYATRIESAKRAYFGRLAQRSAKARAAKRLRAGEAA